MYETNSTSLAVANQPVKKILARHTGRKAAKATEEGAENLSAELYVCIGAKIILTTNLWNKVGV